MSIAERTDVGEQIDAPGVRRVMVRGVTGALGARVLAQLAELDHVIVVHGDRPGVDPSGADAPAALPPCDTIVELGVGDHDTRARRRESVTIGVAELLNDAAATGATHLVLVSSAMVYGAAPNNPVPITENAVLRPDPQFVYARQLASVEGVVEEWRRNDRARAVAVLRPAVSMAVDGTSSIARALAAGLGQRFAEDDPGAQFVHLDDVASAVAIAVSKRLDGVYNVAPDGWVPGERVRALSGETPRLPLPARVREVVGALRWRFQRGPIPPGLDTYTRESWVIANDRLRAEGWVPTVTNEQAYVEGTEAKWWTMITPKRRQELALGALVVLGVAGAASGLSLVWRWRRRRRRSG